MAPLLDRRPVRRRILAGGSAAVEPDGRPLAIAAGPCRALVRDRHATHRCQRRGWFALREPGGEITSPLCSTHLRALASVGGVVVEGVDRADSRAA